MECKMTKDLPINVSMCDHSAQMSIPHMFTLFMDLACEHADRIGAGAPQGRFWMTYRSRVRIHRRPALFAQVTATTWPQQPKGIRNDRYYTLQAGDTLLAEGKTEWVLMDLASGRLVPPASLFAPDTVFSTAAVCEGPFPRLNDDFSACEEVARHTVASGDIDLGGHMNNARYVHVLFNTIPTAALQQLSITQVDVWFRTPCFERETLSIRRRRSEGGFDMALLHGDGTVAVMAAFTCTGG